MSSPVHEEHANVLEPPGQLHGIDEFAGTGVGNPVEHDVDAALASRRITQPQLLDIARRIRRPREHAGHQAGEQRASQPSQQPLPDV